MKDSSVSSSKVSAHTQEPWGVSLGATHAWIQDADTNTIFAMHRGNHPASEANARRIVACVNACAGLSTALLESKPLTDSQDGWLKTAVAMERQRDELAEALRYNAEQVYAEFMTLSSHATQAQLDAVMGHVNGWRAVLAKL